MRRVGFVMAHPRYRYGGLDLRFSKDAYKSLAGVTYDVVPDLDNERVWLVSPGKRRISRGRNATGLSVMLRKYGVCVGERIPLYVQDGQMVLRLDRVETSPVHDDESVTK